MSFESVDYSLVGRVLATDLFTEHGILLLPNQTKLTAAHIEILLRQRIREIKVVGNLSEGTGERISSQLMESDINSSTVAAYVEALDKTRMMFDQITRDGAPCLEEFSDIFCELGGQAMKELGLFRSLYVLEGADSYTYRHSLNVGILCSLIARLLKWDEERIAFMGTAGFLHDVGKMRVPKEILLKPGKLTEDEFEIMKKHTVFGYEMIKQMDGSSELIAQCALLHHERLDGSGYPEQRRGDDIPIECQVLAIADIFDAICSDRVYKDRTSPFEAAQLLWREACDGVLNIEIVSQFVRYIALLYVGSKARLSNGEEVEVILINQDEPMRPLIRSNGEFVDLRHDRKLTIEKMIG